MNCNGPCGQGDKPCDREECMEPLTFAEAVQLWGVVIVAAVVFGYIVASIW